jgi:general secretion pathway protein D
MTPRIVRLSLAVFLAATVSRSDAQPPPGGQQTPLTPLAASVAAQGNDPIVERFSLNESTVDTVLEKISEYTGRSILTPGAGLPAGKYTIDRRNIRRSELISALETLLAMNQIAIVPLDERFMKVVPLNTVRIEAPELITGSTLGLPRSGRIASKVYQLDFLRAAEFLQAIQTSVNPQIGQIAQVQTSNAVLVTDSLTNLQRVEELMNLLDKPAAPGAAKFYTLKNGARASDVERKIRAAFGSNFQAQLGAFGSFSSDDRTNKLFLVTDPRLYPVFDSLIENLDVKADPNTRTEVVTLKHAKAADVKAIVNNLVSGQNSAAQRSTSVRLPQLQQNTNFQNAAQPNLPGLTPAAPGGPLGTPGALNFPGAAPAAPQNQAPVISGIDGAAPSNEFSSLVNVVDVTRSNSIVISGTADDVRLVKELVAKLDVVLAQVNIEVIIAEVTLNNTDKSGIQALNLTVGTDFPGAPGGDNGRGTHITNFAGNIAGWSVTEGVVNPLAFKAALADAGGRNSLKVLQAVTIMTSHGAESSITVGEKRQIPSVTQAAVTGGTPTTNYAPTTIALVLTTTPFIGDDGSIQLKIDQKIDDVTSFQTLNGEQVPVIGTRQVVSDLNIFDGQMKVLGGLQRTKNSNDRAKIGFIYELPIISRLFGARTKTAERTELLLFIRPKIMKDETATADTLKAIDSLSNKDQIQQHLKDPGKRTKDSLLEWVK